MFNRREQRALYSLIAALCIGSLASLADYLQPQTLEDFSVVPTAAVPQPLASVVVAQEPIDLNGATAAQLQTLPHIGPKTAARIVEYRSRQGAFGSVEDLQQVRGIGRATLDKLRPLLRISHMPQKQ